MSKGRKFSNQFKHRIVIEALKKLMTLSELAQKFDLHPHQITTWKKEFLEKLKPISISEKSKMLIPRVKILKLQIWKSDQSYMKLVMCLLPTTILKGFIH